jgi:hypothetical protein
MDIIYLGRIDPDDDKFTAAFDGRVVTCDFAIVGKRINMLVPRQTTRGGAEAVTPGAPEFAELRALLLPQCFHGVFGCWGPESKNP